MPRDLLLIAGLRPGTQLLAPGADLLTKVYGAYVGPSQGSVPATRVAWSTRQCKLQAALHLQQPLGGVLPG